MKKLLLVLAICFLTVALASCKTKPGITTETPSVKMYQAPDVPVPANFMHDQKNSSAYVSATVRTTSIKYVGSARTDELIEFYRRQMPAFGWMEASALGVENKQTIVFQKNREKCEILIEQKPSETHLYIKIGFKL